MPELNWALTRTLNHTREVVDAVPCGLVGRRASGSFLLPRPAHEGTHSCYDDSRGHVFASLSLPHSHFPGPDQSFFFFHALCICTVIKQVCTDRGSLNCTRRLQIINLQTPNVTYSCRTAPLTSKVAFYIFIQQI